jgi:DNA-binding CsgD family transcriptional regulator
MYTIFMTYNDYINLLTSFSDKNKYYYTYLKLITKASNRNNLESLKDFQRHHIVPKSFIIDDDIFINSRFNLVSLTYKEHVLAHRLLTKFIEGENYVLSLKAFYAMRFHKLSTLQIAKTEEARKLVANVEKPYQKYLEDGKWLYHNYITLGKSTRTISEEISCNRRSLVIALQRANIDRVYLVSDTGIPKWSHFDTLIELKEYIQMCVYNGLNNTLIANKFNIDKNTIQRWSKILEIKPRLWQLKDKEWLNNKYSVELLSMEQIAAELNCNPATVKKWMGNLGIPIRSLQEAATLRKNRNKVV